MNILTSIQVLYRYIENPITYMHTTNMLRRSKFCRYTRLGEEVFIIGVPASESFFPEQKQSN